MKKYLSFFQIRFSTGLQYRAAAWAGVATQFAWGFMKLLLYRAFYRSDPAAFPMNFQDLSSYIWLQQAFLAFFSAWTYDRDILSAITTGDISYELLRPVSLYNMWFVKDVASRSARAMLRFLPVVVVVSFLPAPYRLGPPINLLHCLLFVLTLFLGLLLMSSHCQLMYIASMHLINSQGLRVMATPLVEFLSGSVIALPFFPFPVQQVLALLPFASMPNLPFRIYSGNLAGSEMWFGILLQIFWLVVYQAGGRMWMNRSLKKAVVQGG